MKLLLKKNGRWVLNWPHSFCLCTSECWVIDWFSKTAAKRNETLDMRVRNNNDIQIIFTLTACKSQNTHIGLLFISIAYICRLPNGSIVFRCMLIPFYAIHCICDFQFKSIWNDFWLRLWLPHRGPHWRRKKIIVQIWKYVFCAPFTIMQIKNHACCINKSEEDEKKFTKGESEAKDGIVQAHVLA